MTNALTNISIPRIARAVGNTLAAQRKHKEFKERVQRDTAYSTVRSVVTRVDSESVTEEQLQRTALEVLPAAEKFMSANQSVAARGYHVSHRSIAHLLPAEYKWTVAGVQIINAILAQLPQTKEHFSSWESVIAEHVAEVKRGEDEKKQRREKYDSDNREVFDNLCDEIERLTYMNDRRVESYKHLFNWLRNGGLPRYFRGARGVRLVHAAMIAKVAHHASWSSDMAVDLEEALRRDAEYKNNKAQQQQSVQQRQYQPNNQRADFSHLEPGMGHVIADGLFEIDPANEIPGESISNTLEDGYMEAGGLA